MIWDAEAKFRMIKIRPHLGVPHKWVTTTLITQTLKYKGFPYFKRSLKLQNKSALSVATVENLPVNNIR